MPKNNHTTEVGLLIQYIGIIIFILSICYIVVITNPPAELLEYNENLRGMVTRQLSYHEFANLQAILVPFLGIFALVMFFSGYLAGFTLLREAGKKVSVTVIPYFFIQISVILLGYLLLPYYGVDLAFVAFAIGLAAFITGAMSEKRAAIRLSAFAGWILAALLTGINTNLGIGLAILFYGMIIIVIVEIPHFFSQLKTEKMKKKE